MHFTITFKIYLTNYTMIVEVWNQSHINRTSWELVKDAYSKAHFLIQKLLHETPAICVSKGFPSDWGMLMFKNLWTIRNSQTCRDNVLPAVTSIRSRTRKYILAILLLESKSMNSQLNRDVRVMTYFRVNLWTRQKKKYLPSHKRVPSLHTYAALSTRKLLLFAAKFRKD